MADRVGPVVEDKGELPRSDLRRVRVRGEAWLPGCESGNRDGAETVEGEAVEAGAAFLTERELETAVRLAKRHGDVLAVTAGTGLRFGEISALWVGDVDLDRGTVRVNKAWKRNGEDDATETPGWLSRQLRAKHTMRDHHLGHPKTPRSRRTIMIAPTVAALRGGMAMTQVSWLSSPQLALARVRWSSDEIRVRNDAAPVTVQLARFSCSLSGDTDRRTVLRLFLGRRRPRSAGAGLARLGSIKRAGPRPPILIQVRRVRCA